MPKMCIINIKPLDNPESMFDVVHTLIVAFFGVASGDDQGRTDIFQRGVCSGETAATGARRKTVLTVGFLLLLQGSDSGGSDGRRGEPGGKV